MLLKTNLKTIKKERFVINFDTKVSTFNVNVDIYKNANNEDINFARSDDLIVLVKCILYLFPYASSFKCFKRLGVEILIRFLRSLDVSMVDLERNMEGVVNSNIPPPPLLSVSDRYFCRWISSSTLAAAVIDTECRRVGLLLSRGTFERSVSMEESRTFCSSLGRTDDAT